MPNETSAPQPFQQRVIDEKAELDDKRAKLISFVKESPFYTKLPEAEQQRLMRQHICMTEYSEILAERIAAF